jgi:hypothetical protein
VKPRVHAITTRRHTGGASEEEVIRQQSREWEPPETTPAEWDRIAAARKDRPAVPVNGEELAAIVAELCNQHGRHAVIDAAWEWDRIEPPTERARR